MADAKSAGIQERITTIHDKAETAQDLQEEVQEIKTKRQKAEHKNRAFDALETVFQDLEEQFAQLMAWCNYASELDLAVSTERIASEVRATTETIHSFTGKTWEDFEDATEINEVEDTVREHRKVIKELTEDVRETVQDLATGTLDQVERRLTLLQIPDIGDEDDLEVCQNHQHYLKQIRDGALQGLNPATVADQHAQFETLEIDLGGDLSDDAKDVIWELLQDDTVTLAEIDETVLSDLKTLEQFSKRLSIQFTKQQ